MARIVVKKVNKRKRRGRIQVFNLTVVIFGFSAFLYLVSALLLHTYNNSLSIQIQQINSEISTLKAQNDALNVEISTLVSVDRIDEIATNSGLSRNQNNIIRIENNPGEGE